MYLKEIGEDRIIKGLARRFLRPHPRLIKAIGDDASVTVQKGGLALLATTDILIEDTHFLLNRTTPYLLGKKALSISLSDIAAMGGSPLFFLVSVAMPPKTAKAFLDGLYRGISERARRFGAALVGGNTARSSKIMVSTTLLGEEPLDEAVYRSGAKAGEDIYLTGTVGDSALGLKALTGQEDRRAFRKAVLKHLDPMPRVEAGRALAKKRLASAMIDVSDGLIIDLRRLCEESGAGAVIHLERLPLSTEFRSYMGKERKKAIILALSGGEDYELLFTAPTGFSKKIAALGGRLNLPMTNIGKMVRGKGVKVLDSSGRIVWVSKPGFEHF